MLLSLGLAKETDDRVIFTNAAALFFAHAPKQFFPQAEIICAAYDSGERVDFVDRLVVESTIVSSIEDTVEWILSNLKKRYAIEGLQRVQRPEVPKIVLREVITNAIMHRDYTYHGQSIHVDIFPSKIIVRNPGGLVEGMREDDLGKKSMRRNPKIADILDKADYVDRMGTGINRMRKELEAVDLPPPSFSTNSHFQVQIQRASSGESLTEVSEAELNNRQKEALERAYKQGRITTKWYAEKSNINMSKARREIKDMIRKGLLEKRGRKTGTYYVPAQ